jgi:hypothetical protein
VDRRQIDELGDFFSLTRALGLKPPSRSLRSDVAISAAWSPSRMGGDEGLHSPLPSAARTGRAHHDARATMISAWHQRAPLRPRPPALSDVSVAGVSYRAGFVALEERWR